jgi:uncharacterized protein HemX
MNPYLIIAALLAVIGAGAGGFKLGVDHEKAGQASKQEAVAEAVDAANNVWADKVASLKPTYTTIQNKLEKQIETNTVYRDCRLDPVGLQLANQALTGGAKPVGQGELPKADAVGK